MKRTSFIMLICLFFLGPQQLRADFLYTYETPAIANMETELSFITPSLLSTTTIILGANLFDVSLKHLGFDDSEWDILSVEFTDPSTNPSITVIYDYGGDGVWDLSITTPPSSWSPFIAVGTYTNSAENRLKLTISEFSTPVPEPATLFLLGFGIVGLAGLGRKSRIS